MANAFKIGSIIGQSVGLGIGATAALMKWTASLVSFRNKGDTAYIPIAVQNVQVYDSAGVNKTILGFAVGAGVDRTINFPPTAGTNGQVVQTDGANNWSYISAGSTAQCYTQHTSTLAFGTASPLAMYTLPIGSVMIDVRVVVDTPFTGGTGATMSLGTSAAAARPVPYSRYVSR